MVAQQASTEAAFPCHPEPQRADLPRQAEKCVAPLSMTGLSRPCAREEARGLSTRRPTQAQSCLELMLIGRP